MNTLQYFYQINHNNNENELIIDQTKMTDFKATCWILSFQLQSSQSFYLHAELQKVFQEQFKIENQIQKIMILRYINTINLLCQIGQYYLNMENGKICYKIKFLVYNLEDDQMESFISLAETIMFNDFKKYLYLILVRCKTCSLFHPLNQENQDLIKTKIKKIFNFQNLSSKSEQFNQINEIQIFEEKYIQIKKNYYQFQFILKQLDGDKLQLRLYKTEYEEIEKNNLMKIGFFIQANNKSLNCTIFNQYLQVYFYQNKDFYYLKNQYYSLEQYLIEQSIKLSLSTKLFTLLNIAKGISFLHQNKIIHSYINLKSIYVIPKYRTSPYIGHLEKAYCQMIQSEYKYQNLNEYTPLELKNNTIKYPNKKTDIYQFGILMLSFIFEVSNEELYNFRLELFKERIFKSGHNEIMSEIYQLFIQCLQEPYLCRSTIEEVIKTLKQIIELLDT